ncbi:hypothetical protein TNCV_4178171 [Trichonephila clavipes]|nr:hypothetical protein TNCV_4178171 [Trichonephila clavipes]
MSCNVTVQEKLFYISFSFSHFKNYCALRIFSLVTCESGPFKGSHPKRQRRERAEGNTTDVKEAVVRLIMNNDAVWGNQGYRTVRTIIEYCVPFVYLDFSRPLSGVEFTTVANSSKISEQPCLHDTDDT